MFKHTATLLATLGLCVIATAARADPISACAILGQDADGADLLTCNMYETDGTGAFSEVSSPADDPFGAHDFFNSYVILWENPAHTTASDVLVFAEGVAGVSADTITLYSDGSALFQTILAAAQSSLPEQLLQLNETTFPTTFNVNFQSSLQNPAGPFTCTNPSNCDTINVFSDINETDVPEPATISLVSIGAVTAMIRRRRA